MRCCYNKTRSKPDAYHTSMPFSRQREVLQAFLTARIQIHQRLFHAPR